MNSFLLTHVLVYQAGRFEPGEILCMDGRIVRTGTELPRPEGAAVLDGRGLRAVPGFMDIHTHGAAGVDVNAADEAGLRKMAAFSASQGVISFNASILTDSGSSLPL